MDAEIADLVIVGSGYGGAVVASRLAGARRVVVVERGRRYGPGDFPDGLVGLIGAYQRPGADGRGLWGVRLGRGVGNAYASAYGGGSVLNYGYLGQTPTAPGQWPCRLLKEAIERLPL